MGQLAAMISVVLLIYSRKRWCIATSGNAKEHRGDTVMNPVFATSSGKSQSDTLVGLAPASEHPDEDEEASEHSRDEAKAKAVDAAVSQLFICVFLWYAPRPLLHTTRVLLEEVAWARLPGCLRLTVFACRCGL